MRLVILGNANGYGGAQTAFRELVQFLLTDRHTVEVISLTDRVEWQEQFGGVSLLRTSGLPLTTSTIASSLKKLVGLLELVVRFRCHAPDAFIAVGLSNTGDTLARMLPRRTFRIAIDYIATRSEIDRQFQRSLTAFNRIALQSLAMKDIWSARGVPCSQIITLPCFPNPVDIKWRKYGKCKKRIPVRLAYFGRLARNKGVVELLWALHAVGATLDIKLDVWGVGPESRRIAEVIRSAGLTGCVSQRGSYPSGSAGSELMAGYDGIVVPSQGLEGLPLILLEAMGLGVPALCTDVGAIPDCCNDNPDFVLTQPTLAGLVDGLHIFARRTLAAEFDHDRLFDYYSRNYSPEAIGCQWRAFLSTI